LVAVKNPVIKAFGACYDAIEAAASFSELSAKYVKGFSYPNAEAMFAAYQKSYIDLTNVIVVLCSRMMWLN
jgi:hypothetical protein